jgi:hypothetical protein
MKDLWNRLVRQAESKWSRYKIRNAEQRRHEQEVDAAIERIVDQVNPRLRAVGGYRKALFPVVERTLEYVRELTQQVPGPVLVDRKTWSSDPQINALFGSVDRLRRVLSGTEVRRYLKQHPLGGDCYAVFAAMPEIKNQLGVELVGETLQKDVRQTAVSFKNHEVGLVGESEDAVRRALPDEALELLVSLAVQEILEQESRISEFEERLRVVRLKLKVAETKSKGIGLLIEDNPERVKETDAKRARVAELEKDLEREKRGLSSLDDHLDRLVELLRHPEAYFGLERVRVRLDRMNIVREEDDKETGNEIDFARGRRGNKLARVILLIRFPRSEIMEQGERLREIERYLG